MILIKENWSEIVVIIGHAKGQNLVVKDLSDIFKKLLIAALGTVYKLVAQVKKHHDKLMDKVKNHNSEQNKN